jgi:hypothetical protein
MARVFRGILLVAGILALTAGTANAQAIGSIFGKVTDQSGGVLPGVTVTVAGTGLQQPLSGVTQASGAYQFPSVPIGTYSVTFELTGFKKAVRQNIVIDTGFQAQVDMKLEIGTLTEELTVSAAAPVVDTKKTTTGSTFTSEIFNNIPTARDPWQIIGMTPGVQAGMNVGGSSSGQQVGLSIFGTSANVQWNLEGGSITDLSSNSSPSYFNFESFEQIQVVTGGGDVSVQSSGLSINLVTKSGSNVFKGTALFTFENDAMQSNNVSETLFNSSSSGFLSGNPIQRIGNYSVEYGGPIKRNRLWFWGAGDWQDINAGVLNFFDGTKGQFCQDLITLQKNNQLSGAVTYDQLQDVQNCLQNDKTTIKNLSWKFNYQLNAANKFQYLFQSDNKYRNRRGASATTLVEAVTQQTSDMPKWIGYWGLPLPTHSLTHTLILTDRLVFNNQFTYVHGGFYLDYQDVPPQGDCSQSKYIPFETNPNNYPQVGNPNCLWNVQPLFNRTTGISSRSLGANYETQRHSWEAKTDGTYFLSNVMGGDHSLKFGVGWRRNPILTFTHYSGGARVSLQCWNNQSANCSETPVTPGSTQRVGLVPRAVTVGTDGLPTNNDWWTYNGYIQESYSRGKLRLNGGVRYDWQTSKQLAGCVAAATIDIRHPGTGASVLPAFCQEETDTDPVSGKKLQPFSNWAPRVSATYDLMGNGKTQLHASYSLYFATKITLANQLNNLNFIGLTWGNMQNNGLCSTTNNASCWQDLNLDGFVQTNELSWVQGSQIGGMHNGSGIPSGPGRFNIDTGAITPAQNTVDESAQIGRTREAIVGMQHELIPNLALGVDYVYRNYDRGTTTYPRGLQPGCETSTLYPCVSPGYPVSSIYNVVNYYTDPVTGITAPYYTVAPTVPPVVLTTGLSNITMTQQNYNVYHGVILQANKRFSDKWQMNASITMQSNPGYNVYFTNPTGVEYTDGISSIARYLLKVSGAYAIGWGVMVSGNYNMNDGANRTLSIDGPGTVPLGTVSAAGNAQTIAYNTLNFQPTGTTRFNAVKLLDLGVSKTFALRGGKNRLKVMLDGFNVLNEATITGFSSSNRSSTGFTQPSNIIPPRVLRVGAQFGF